MVGRLDVTAFVDFDAFGHATAGIRTGGFRHVEYHLDGFLPFTNVPRAHAFGDESYFPRPIWLALP